jgi:hypothetical protein
MATLPELTTTQGMYDWLLALTVLFAAFLGALLLASFLGFIPPIDQLDGGGALLFPVAPALGLG